MHSMVEGALRRGKPIIACPVFRARKKRAVVSRPLSLVG